MKRPRNSKHMSIQAARRAAQERVCRQIPPTVSLSKELMAERKAEAKRESQMR
jgi:hypothetical protein